MSDATKGGYAALLKLPVPRRLALASVPADFSDWLDYAAVVALVVFAWGEGPVALAMFALALSLPYVLVGPFVAVLVDRAPTRTVLVLSNLGRGLATLGFAFAGDTLVLLALVFLRGCIDSAFTPARQAAIQASTPEHLRGVAAGLLAGAERFHAQCRALARCNADCHHRGAARAAGARRWTWGVLYRVAQGDQ
jgi:MFS family permease